VWLYSAPFLVEKATVAIPIVGAILIVFSLTNYLICAFTDPGFLPRATAYEAFYIEKKNSKK
jgi:hypothetical protein